MEPKDYMLEAIRLASAGVEGRRGRPFGCVVVRRGEIVGRGNNAVTSTNDPTAHAEMLAFAAAAGSLTSGRRDRILGCTREPCVMCTGAAMPAAIDTIVYGMPAPADSGTGRVVPPETAESQMPRIVGGVLEKDCSRLFREMTQGKS